MAQQFNYIWTVGSEIYELIYGYPANKKNVVCRGASTRSYPFIPSFGIGGIFYALE